MKHVYNSDTNANGEKLLDFCEENSLKVANGEFQKKKGVSFGPGLAQMEQNIKLIIFWLEENGGTALKM